MGEANREASELPAPSAELSVIGVLIDVLLDELPKRRRDRFVRRVNERLEWLADNVNVVRLRAPGHDNAAVASHRLAHAWWQRLEERWLRRPR